jgi:hypothetical protein
MKDRLNCLLSEVGESFDAPLAAMSGTGIRFMAELEELIESYCTFATTLILSTSVERATRRKLVARKPSGSLGQRQTPGRKKIALGVDE